MRIIVNAHKDILDFVIEKWNNANSQVNADLTNIANFEPHYAMAIHPGNHQPDKKHVPYSMGSCHARKQTAVQASP